MQNEKNFNVWITVAYRTGMRIYNYQTAHNTEEITLVHEIENPDGYLKDEELGSDHPGRSFDSVGGGRHSLSASQSPSQHVSERFAKEISKLLEEARNNRQYSKLILIAGPAFLGLLRQHLSAHTMELVIHVLNKDFVKLTNHEMQKYLQKNIQSLLTEKHEH